MVSTVLFTPSSSLTSRVRVWMLGCLNAAMALSLRAVAYTVHPLSANASHLITTG